MRNNNYSRRAFLGQAAPVVITTAALGRAARPPASDRVTLGFVGLGTRGHDGLLKESLKHPECQCVAVCDPFTDRREKSAQLANEHYAKSTTSGSYKGAQMYNDFRELIARSDIDGVMIATPDHWHVPIAIAAARAGKDVYVEKPLGLTMEQNIAIRKVIQKTKRMFQYGTQQRGAPHVRFGCELVRKGGIGKITAIEVTAPAGSPGGKVEEIPVPAGFDYDLWLGPAPKAPYMHDRCVGYGRYFIYDYSIGYLGGWGAHPLDVLDWGLPDPTPPVEYEGTGKIPTEGLFNTVTTWDIRAKYANGVTLSFKDGPDFTKFIGADGWVVIQRSNLDAEPKSLIASYTQGVKAPQTAAHTREFLDSIRSRKQPAAPVEAAVRSDTVSQLSDIAIRTGRKIRWDAVKEKIIGDAAASKMLSRPMRKPWHL